MAVPRKLVVHKGTEMWRYEQPRRLGTLSELRAVGTNVSDDSPEPSGNVGGVLRGHGDHSPESEMHNKWVGRRFRRNLAPHNVAMGSSRELCVSVCTFHSERFAA